MAAYPWYGTAPGDSLEQGDIFWNYTLYDIQSSPELFEDRDAPAQVSPITSDVIVLTQSCDLGNEKVDSVILCPIWPLPKFLAMSPDANRKARDGLAEDVRKGFRPQWHMLNCPPHCTDVIVVEFKRIHTTPKDLLRSFASRQSNRIRLLPPYREHLSQAFARYFMRVGLPTDIKAFR